MIRLQRAREARFRIELQRRGLFAPSLQRAHVKQRTACNCFEREVVGDAVGIATRNSKYALEDSSDEEGRDLDTVLWKFGMKKKQVSD